MQENFKLRSGAHAKEILTQIWGAPAAEDDVVVMYLEKSDRAYGGEAMESDPRVDSLPETEN